MPRTAPPSRRRSAQAPRVRRRIGDHRAFTLVEILMVVAIIGLIGAIVVPHMLQAGTLGVQAAVRIVIADLLLAQNEAIAQQKPYGMSFDVANNRYRIIDDAGHPVGMNWGGDQVDSAGKHLVDFGADQRFSGVHLVSADFGGSNEVRFDELGSPTSGGTIELQFDAHRYRITVAAFTGRITAAQVP